MAPGKSPTRSYRGAAIFFPRQQPFVGGRGRRRRSPRREATGEVWPPVSEALIFVFSTTCGHFKEGFRNPKEACLGVDFFTKSRRAAGFGHLAKRGVRRRPGDGLVTNIAFKSTPPEEAQKDEKERKKRKAPKKAGIGAFWAGKRPLFARPGPDRFFSDHSPPVFARFPLKSAQSRQGRPGRGERWVCPIRAHKRGSPGVFSRRQGTQNLRGRFTFRLVWGRAPPLPISRL